MPACLSGARPALIPEPCSTPAAIKQHGPGCRSVHGRGWCPFRNSLINDGNWRLTGTLTSYLKTSTNQGTVTGTGTLSWWNPALNEHHGGWQPASKSVTFTASFSSTNTTAPGTFGIQIAYTPAPPPPAMLPNSALLTLQSGIIAMA